MSKRWFVLRVGTNRENRVKKQLWSSIQTHDLTSKVPQLLVVTERVTEIKGGQRKTVERKVYPGYVMAEIEVDDENGGKIPPEVWHLIREMPGQIKFVGNPDDPDKPQPLGPDEVSKMLAQVERLKAEEPVTTMDFTVGEHVVIREGSFENFEGTVEELLPDKGLVKVSIMVFGRPTPIDFESWKLEKKQST